MDRTENHLPFINRNSPPEEKIRLFKELFRGREDVYARRFESRKTGRAGYAPACGNEWVRGVCEKPKVQCAVCRSRAFLPVDEDAIRSHLTGRDADGKPFVMGCYPLLLDETCHFLAMDLDKADWQVDARALLVCCEEMQVPASLERSRSGNGGHVWVFFSETVSASLARKLGAILITHTMQARPDLGFESYDRLFLNQDTLPRGGFGNLIALPLLGEARKAGNSVFVDSNLNPIEDQWAFLSSISRWSLEELETWLQHHVMDSTLGVRVVPEDSFSLAPWTARPSRREMGEVKGPFPDRIPFVLADQIYLPKEILTPSLRNRLLRLAAFQNPEFYKAQAMRLPVYNTPRIIACAEEYDEHLALPRGCLEDMKVLFRDVGIRYRKNDKRCKGEPLDVTFQGDLREDQQAAADALLAHDTGVLSATTAFGKTVLAAWIIAERGVNTLVLVHRRQLMDQWVERLVTFLGMEDKEIGRLGGGRCKLKGRVDIALLQSVVRKRVVDDRVADYGQVIVDECHHISARNFELAIRRAKAKFILGLSATVTRKDGHHPIIFMQCGPVRHRVEAKEHKSTSALDRRVLVRPTRFVLPVAFQDEEHPDFVTLMDSLIRDEVRNRQICEDVQHAVQKGRSVLVLTERTEHVELLSVMLGEIGLRVVSVRGGMSKKGLQTELGRLDVEPESVLVATGKFIGEGFDHPRLDTLFLAMPISWKGTLAQYVGRLHRRCEGKERVEVVDIADLNVPMLGRMFDRRCRAYEKLGYTILMPASALPGWPTEVPLPVEAGWKRKYSASVRRLVRDGVDVPLAELFVDVTEFCDPGQKVGEDRARSASEAFLFRRLESLELTKGRFALNTRLPIPFAGHGSMEVDFLDADRKLVLELDGPNHFEDRDTFRRDRMKDARLQERGYRVHRFLTEDLGGRLDHVLDEILRASQGGFNGPFP